MYILSFQCKSTKAFLPLPYWCIEPCMILHYANEIFWLPYPYACHAQIHVILLALEFIHVHTKLCLIDVIVDFIFSFFVIKNAMICIFIFPHVTTSYPMNKCLDLLFVYAFVFHPFIISVKHMHYMLFHGWKCQILCMPCFLTVHRLVFNF